MSDSGQVIYGTGVDTVGDVETRTFRSIDGGVTWNRLTHPLLSTSGGGRIFCSKLGDKVLLLSSGIKISHNYGVTWTEKTLPSQITAFGGIAVSPNLDKIFVYQTASWTGSDYKTLARPTLIFLSNDYGASWEQANFPTTETLQGISTCNSDSSGTQKWCAVTSGYHQYFPLAKSGVYTSTDYGYNWTRVGPSSVTDMWSGIVGSQTNNTIIAYKASGLGVSTDFGQTWVMRTMTTNSNVCFISKDTSVIMTVFYSSSTPGSEYTFRRSTNLGVSFDIINPLASTTSSLQKTIKASKDGSILLTAPINAASTTASVAYYPGPELFNLSSDSLRVYPQGELIFANLHKCVIGDKMILTTDKALLLCLAPPGSGNISTTSSIRGFITKTYDRGQTSTAIKPSVVSSASYKWDANSTGQHIVVSSTNRYYGNRVLKSSDFGNSWSPIRTISEVQQLKVSDSGQIILVEAYVSSKWQVSCSINGGSTWTTVVNSSSPNRLFISKDDKYISVLEGFKTHTFSTDYGVTWTTYTLTSTGLPSGVIALGGYIFEPQISNGTYKELAVRSVSGVNSLYTCEYQLNSIARNWTSVNINLPANPYNIIDPVTLAGASSSGNTLFLRNAARIVSSAEKIYYLIRSDDGGQTWTNLPKVGNFANAPMFIVDGEGASSKVYAVAELAPSYLTTYSNFPASKTTGNCCLIYSEDGGQTWQENIQYYPQITNV
jgi:hypothetical protein